ncbi:MAG TPA: hypothetical protein VJN94_01200 [Candidatus Binataceae bacterium]|nr:hypothetical protein [Candidatus Binataceae bacterium]
MRRYLQIAFSLWFAISMAMVEACTSAAQSTSGYTNSPGASYNTGDRSRYDSGSAANDPYSADPADSSASSHPDESGYAPDHSESQALTDYLTQHRLPLVGAQVLRGSDGRRIVVLYGFVGTDFGKSDAVAKARRFLGDSGVPVDNRINVRPELLASNPPSRNSGYAPNPGAPSNPGDASNPDDSSAQPDSSSSYPDAQNYLNRRNQMTQQSAIGSMVPLLALLALGMSMAGGSSSFSMGSSPFGSSPFGNSPYGSNPFTSPYGPSPYGGSPYGPPYSGPGAYPGP